MKITRRQLIKFIDKIIIEQVDKIDVEAKTREGLLAVGVPEGAWVDEIIGVLFDQSDEYNFKHLNLASFQEDEVQTSIKNAISKMKTMPTWNDYEPSGEGIDAIASMVTNPTEWFKPVEGLGLLDVRPAR